jgi:bacterioferritin (cytochrome b1)
MNWTVPSDTLMREHVDIVDELNRLMAEEAEACLRYFQLRYRLRGIDRQAAEQFFENGVKETLEHAEAIATQIRALGHVPRLRIDLSLGGGPIRFQDALAEALDVEQQALGAYKDFLPRVVGHPVLEDFIRRQIDIETEHVQEIVDTVRAGSPLKLLDKPNNP